MGGSTLLCGSSSAVERRLPKPKVAGSNPVSRSKLSLDISRVQALLLFFRKILGVWLW